MLVVADGLAAPAGLTLHPRQIPHGISSSRGPSNSANSVETTYAARILFQALVSRAENYSLLIDFSCFHSPAMRTASRVLRARLSVRVIEFGFFQIPIRNVGVYRNPAPAASRPRAADT